MTVTRKQVLVTAAVLAAVAGAMTAVRVVKAGNGAFEDDED